MKKYVFLHLLLFLFLTLSHSTVAQECEGEIILRLDVKQDTDSTFTVKLFADGFKDIAGYQLSMVFNGSDYVLIDSDVFRVQGTNFVSNFGNGYFDIVWLDALSASANSDVALITLNFKKIGSENIFIKIDEKGTAAVEFTNDNAKIICAYSDDFLNPNLGQLIEGKIYFDENNNCQGDANEYLNSNWSVNVKTPSKEYLLKVQADGTFKVRTFEIGSYTITSIPSDENWVNCEDSKIFIIDSFNISDRLNCDFLVQYTSIPCPIGEVLIQNHFLRRCFNNNYFIQYKNLGTAPLENAKVEINLDDKFNFVSCSNPNFNLLDRILTVDVGNLEPFEEGEFYFTINLDCELSLLGETHCVEAKILPVIDCDLIPYSGPKLDLTAKCENDSIKFKITNVGQEAMSKTVSYIVVEDDVMNIQKPIQLQALQSEDYHIKATQATYRMIVPQVEEYKKNTFITKAIEACGNTNPNLGFITNFSESDEESHIDILCVENRGSYDPNDISVNPSGYSDMQYILPNTELEYFIRFQNTGTDTAFTVLIRDTLDHRHDVTSVILGNSSHEVEFTIEEERILIFKFKNILLLDSFTNEAASHGFISYKIKPIKDIDAVPLSNQAHIYFDFNKPIATNKINQYIASWFLTSDNNVAIEDNIVTVYPNPANKFINFKNPGQIDLTINIFDDIGNQVETISFSSEYYHFNASRLKGLYFCQILLPDGKREAMKFIIY